MEEKLIKLQEILKKHNQEHLLNDYEKLNDTKKEILLNQILNIDFDLIKKLYENANKKPEIIENEITPIEYIEKDKMDSEEKEKYNKIGEEVIKAGGLAVITMAGGQGTRLGFKRPKRSLHNRIKFWKNNI